MRYLRVASLALLLVVAGCSAPVARDPGVATPADQATAGTPSPPPATAGPTPGVETPPRTDADGEFADPDSDVRGWEDGYWAEEPVPVAPADGLDERERSAVVARSMARVERVRGVEFERPVEVEVVSREEFASSPAAGGGNGDSPAAAYRDARYEALFLLGEGTGSGNATGENRRQSVQGYYDPGSGRVVLVSPTATPRIDEGTLSQELFHAYQYRHLIPNRIPALATYDGTQAVLSVIEGDANLVQYRYERRCREEWSCLSGRASPGGDDGNGNGDGAGDGSSAFNFGVYLLQYFPYAEGEQYVRETYERAGWDGVDALYEALPTTTAAVIHHSNRRATEVDLPVVDANGWHIVERRGRGNYGVVGEAGLAGMFGYTLYDDRNATLIERSAFLNVENGSLSDTNPLDYGLEPSSGWRGDRFRVYENGADETAYVWRIRFADAAAASEFAARYRDLLRYRGAEALGGDRFRIPDGRFADAFAVHRNGDTVTVVNAPTAADVGAIAPDL